MRHRLADFLLEYASHPDLIETLTELNEITATPLDTASIAVAAAPVVTGPIDLTGAAPEVTGRPMEPSQTQLEAVRWACDLTDPCFLETRALITALPPWALDLHVAAYEARIAKSAGTRACVPFVPLDTPECVLSIPSESSTRKGYRVTKLKYRADEGRRFVKFMKQNNLDPHAKWPYGLVGRYVNQCERAKERLKYGVVRKGKKAVIDEAHKFYKRAVNTWFAMQRTGSVPDITHTHAIPNLERRNGGNALASQEARERLGKRPRSGGLCSSGGARSALALMPML